MKRLFLLLLIAGLFSCNSAKRAQKQLSTGNYEQAIEIAVNHLQRNKTRKRGQQQMLILEEAFKKLKARDKRRLRFLKKEKVEANIVEIHQIYEKLSRIQDKIRPLLPLYHEGAGRDIRFRFVDYSQEIINSRNELVEFYYHEAQELLQTGEKYSARQAYDDLKEIESLRPNYKNTRVMMEDAYYIGTDFVLVDIQNKTNTVIPRQVHEMLTDFNTFGLDEFWTQYHAEEEPELDYDYGVKIEFMNFMFSPDQLREKEETLSREVVDGWQYKTDRNGNYILDDEGNKIKEDVYVEVEGVLFHAIQQKSVAVEARVIYRDFKQGQNINTFPLTSEFMFENAYGSFSGDARVLNDEEKQVIKNKPVPFPSNERMLIDASEDIKQQLRYIIRRNSF
ncbi:MAG: hypothetical protein ACQESK_10555 [Bacteroidota bacterium]